KLSIPAAKSPTGKDISVAATDMLRGSGPILNVEIMPGRLIREVYEKSNQQYPRISVRALIDSGASGSVITPKIAQQLKLKQTGYQTVASVNNQQAQPVFYGSIGFPWGKYFDTGLVACPLTGADCLIGRDILRFWYLTYDGPSGTIVICD
ncbi:MAG: retropepsin-like aspartic protease, partial [candidate division Zixibacteria bacterium]|nr:retropepsin-like aspartic protease [candidate division Zixibacteria bacterium]